VSRYQKGKTNLDFTEARDNEWQWHQLGHMQVCISLRQITIPVPRHSSFFTGWMPFLPPNQQRQSTEVKSFFVLCSTLCQNGLPCGCNKIFLFIRIKTELKLPHINGKLNNIKLQLRNENCIKTRIIIDPKAKKNYD